MRRRELLGVVALAAFVMWYVAANGALLLRGADTRARAAEWSPIDLYSERDFATRRGRWASHTAQGTYAQLQVPPHKPQMLRTDALDNTEASEDDGGVNAGGVVAENMKLAQAMDLIRMEPVDFSDTSLLDKCPHTFKEADLNLKYIAKFKKLFSRLKVHWWLDEGGLIGAARAGGMSNADDDFDFFALLPEQIHPCEPNSLTCTSDQFNKMIHSFLLEFWNEGMCINNFEPELEKFNSKNKLMYSIMLDRDHIYQPHATNTGARCFEHGKTPRFAHMHLAMLNEDGELATNVWAKPRNEGGHAHDKIPASVVLPVTRCRTGPVEAPCPNDIPLFLKLRNEGEYNKSSSQGNCLLVRKKWTAERKEHVITLTKQLHECGYNSMHSLIEPAIRSNYMTC